MSDNVLAVIGSWFIITLAVERTTEIIHTSKLFHPLRNYFATLALDDIDRPIVKPIANFVFSIVSCGWCLSVWVSLFFCIFLPSGSGFVFVRWFGLVGTSNLWHAIFRIIHLGRVFTVDIKHTFDDQPLIGQPPKDNIILENDNEEYREGFTEEI